MENALVEKIDSLTNGEILDIEEVPDSVFSSKLMGMDLQLNLVMD